MAKALTGAQTVFDLKWLAEPRCQPFTNNVRIAVDTAAGLRARSWMSPSVGW